MLLTPKDNPILATLDNGGLDVDPTRQENSPKPRIKDLCWTKYLKSTKDLFMVCLVGSLWSEDVLIFVRQEGRRVYLVH